MLIDWFTVAAQIVNFLILVWLLGRFLYRPILNAIDEREKRIAAQVAEAAEERSRAHAERATYEDKNRELTTEREQILAAARKAANEERSALLEEARSENVQLRERLTAELVEQREEIARAIGTRVEDALFETTRRLIADLSDRTLEDAVLSVFVRHLQALSGEDRERLGSSLAAEGSKPVMRTAFELSPTQRSAVEAALKQIASAVRPLRYERAPELIGGVELVTDGHCLSWSMASYLAGLRQKVDIALMSVAKP